MHKLSREQDNLVSSFLPHKLQKSSFGIQKSNVSTNETLYKRERMYPLVSERRMGVGRATRRIAIAHRVAAKPRNGTEEPISEKWLPANGN